MFGLLCIPYVMCLMGEGTRGIEVGKKNILGQVVKKSQELCVCVINAILKIEVCCMERKQLIKGVTYSCKYTSEYVIKFHSWLQEGFNVDKYICRYSINNPSCFVTLF